MSHGATNGKSGKTESFEWAKGKPFDIFTRDGECRNPFSGGCNSNGQDDVNNFNHDQGHSKELLLGGCCVESWGHR